MKRVGVFTSIPPVMMRMVGDVDYGPAVREACVRQWLLAGYPVFSLNSETELAQLSQNPMGAKILSNGTSGERTSVGHMVQLAIQQKLEVAIFTNADCPVLDISRLKRVVASVEPDGVCLLERLNIDPKTLHATGQHCAGFDAFIVGAKALEFMKRDSTWKIGDTWWDYWFPVSILLAGGRLQACTSPLLMHINHPLRWNFESWKQNGERFALDVWSKDFSEVGRDFQDFFVQQRKGKLTHERLSAIGDFTFDWLKKNAIPVDPAPLGTFDDLKNRILSENAEFKSVNFELKPANAEFKSCRPLSILKKLIGHG